MHRTETRTTPWMEEVERRRKPKPSVQGLHEELSTELTPLSGKKAIFRDALKVLQFWPC